MQINSTVKFKSALFGMANGVKVVKQQVGRQSKNFSIMSIEYKCKLFGMIGQIKS